VQAVLDWAVSAGAEVVPFGGGKPASSACQRASRDQLVRRRIDLKELDRVLEVDLYRVGADQAGATRAGARGALAEHGLTLRLPQSFHSRAGRLEFATRAGGHFATVYNLTSTTSSIRSGR